MEARLADLEARLGAVQDAGPAGGGVDAYPTKHGRRGYFKYRQADGSSSTPRGFTSRRAAVQAKQALDERVRRDEVKISRDTFTQYWVRFLAAKRPYVTRGTLFDYAMHGEKRLLPAFGERKLSSIERADIRAWLADMADVVEAGRLSAKTVNNALALLPCASTRRSMTG
jgi:hypothetical protein